MPVLPSSFRKQRRGPYTDNDEVARRRAHGISQLTKAYARGGVYDDIHPGNRGVLDVNVSKEYDMMSRVRPSADALKKVVSGYSEKIRKKGKR